MASRGSKKGASKPKPQKIGRNAENGRFIPVEEAKAMGPKAVVETIKKGKKKRKT